MAEYRIPDAYSQYLDQLQNTLTSKTETITYDPMSPSVLKSALAKALRPGYDKAIETRNKSAATNRAQIDADAAARGIGASTWVTDVKNRQNNAAAADIANLEGDYQSKLYESLLSRLADQESKKLTVDQANMAAKNNALAQALANTNQWWQLWMEMSDGGKRRGGGGNDTEPFTYSGDPLIAAKLAAAEKERLRQARQIIGANADDTEDIAGYNKAVYSPAKVANARKSPAKRLK